MSAQSELARLLEHPAIWRGTSVAQTEVLPSGFGALDERLPGRGWPRSGLIEILISRFGVGELTLLLPTLAALTSRPMARWSVFVSPPFEPFAPALLSQGVVLDRLLVVRPPAVERPPGRPGARMAGAERRHSGSSEARVKLQKDSSRRRSVEPFRAGALWAFEQTLASGACDLVMAWARSPRDQDIRRLQLAGEQGRALGVLFRPMQAAATSSHAILRLALEATAQGVRATLLKSRGGQRGSVELVLRPAGN